MASNVITKWKGLFRQPSYLLIPDGALLLAQNVLFDRDGIIQPFPGFQQLDGDNNEFKPYEDKIEKFYKFPLPGNYNVNPNDGSLTDARAAYEKLLVYTKQDAQNYDIWDKDNDQASSIATPVDPLLFRPYIKAPPGVAFNDSLWLGIAGKIKNGKTANSLGFYPIGIKPKPILTHTLANSATGVILPGTEVAYRVVYLTTDLIYDIKGTKIKEYRSPSGPSARYVVQNPYKNVLSASRSGVTVTINTDGAPGVTAGNIIKIINSRCFSIPSNAAWASGELTITLSDHGYTAGDIVTLQDCSNPEMEGSFLVDSITDANNFVIKINLTTSTDLFIGKVFKNQNLINGEFVVKAVSSSSFTFDIQQNPNATSDYADLSITPALPGTMIRWGTRVNPTLYVPHGKNPGTTQTILRIYKTEMADIENGLIAGETFYQWYEAIYSSNSIKTITDNVPENLLQDPLYTNDNLVDSSPNDIPPIAATMAYHKNKMFYGNVKGTFESKLLQMLSTQGIKRDGSNYLRFSYGSSYFDVQFSDTSAGTSSPFKTLLWKDVSFTAGTNGVLEYDTGVITVDTDTSHSNIEKKHLLEVGDIVILSGAVDARFRGVYRVKALDGTYPAYKFTVEGLNFAAGTSLTTATGAVTVSPGTAAQQIERTVKFLVGRLNSLADAAVNEKFYFEYVSGPTDLPGKFSVRSFFEKNKVIAVGTELNNIFSPNIYESTKDELTSFDYLDKENRLYFSKDQDPAAVVYDGSREIDVGSNSNKILGLVSLQDSLYIICSEGVWKLLGDSPQDFNLIEVDNTIHCNAPETIQKNNGFVYFLSNKGVIKLGEGGADIISEPIKLDIEKYQQLSNIPFAASSEKDGNYYLFLPQIYYDFSNSYYQEFSNAKTPAAYASLRIFNTKSKMWSEKKIYASASICGQFTPGAFEQDPIVSPGVYDALTGTEDKEERLYIGSTEVNPRRTGTGIYDILKNRVLLPKDINFSDMKNQYYQVTVGNIYAANEVSISGLGTSGNFPEFDQLINLGGMITFNKMPPSQTDSSFYKAKIIKIVSSSTYGARVILDRDVTTWINQATIPVHCYYYQPIRVELEFKPETGGDAFTQKTFLEWQIYPEHNGFSTLEYQWITDLARTANTEVLETMDLSSRNLDFPTDAKTSRQWGPDSGKISATPIRGLIPPMLRRGRSGFLKLVHQMAEEKFTILNLIYIYNAENKKSSNRPEGS